jgi:hypothetical protein
LHHCPANTIGMTNFEVILAPLREMLGAGSRAG